MLLLAANAVAGIVLLPEDLLVAAHVKPRGKCNFAERRDVRETLNKLVSLR